MRFSIGIALIGMMLAGCAAPEGNPDAQPYAGDPGGVIGAPPQALGVASYDPYAKPAPFADMQAGQAAIAPPPPTPLPALTRPMR